ncbi:MAG: glycosyltransferase family 2 protein [Planctomycetota bacterium]
MTPPISLCIANWNKAGKIEATLRSIQDCAWCRELLVFDSGSTDGSDQTARDFGARVEYHDWIDYTTSKRNMVEAATHDWVFILDADEEISTPLREEVANLDETRFSSHPLMWVPRRNYLLGRHVRAWDPDYQPRLFDRTRVTWRQATLHDGRRASEGTETRLAGHLLHNRMSNDFHDYFDGPRFDNRIESTARELFQRGKRTHGVELALRPAFAFFKFYLLKRGFTQGSFGLLVAQKAALSVQLKYARLWHLQQQADE